MIYLISQEIKKIIKREKVFLVLGMLLIFNSFYISNLISVNRGNRGERSIISQIEGLPFDQVLSKLKEFEEQDNLNKGLYQDIRSQIDLSINYGKNISTLISETELNIESQKKGSISEKMSQYIIDTYQYRNINTFTFPKEKTMFLENNLSALLSLLFIAYLATGIYSLEHENRVYNIQKATINNNKLSYSKSITLLIVSLITASVFLLSDLVNFKLFSYVGILSSPLFSLPAYFSSPLNLTIFGFILLKYTFIGIGIWLFSLVFALVSHLTKHTLVSFGVSTILMFYFNGLGAMKSDFLNPFNIFSISESFKSFDMKSVFGLSVLTPFITVIITITLSMLLVILTHIVYIKERG